MSGKQNFPVHVLKHPICTAFQYAAVFYAAYMCCLWQSLPTFYKCLAAHALLVVIRVLYSFYLRSWGKHCFCLGKKL